MSRDSIKMVAMLTMLINHIANVFLPAGQPLTNLCLCIGYFTAVTMCFFLVEGYGCTRSKRRYAGRLLGAELGTASLGFNLSNTFCACTSFSYVLLRLKPRLAVPSSAPSSRPA